MRLLGIDFETTGLDPANDVITEVGAVLWDTETAAPLQVFSMFLDWKLKALDPVVTKLTGITLEMLREFGQDPKLVYQIVHKTAAAGAVAVVAHNGEAFDRLFEGAWAKRVDSSRLALPWIDTQNDIPYSEDIKTRKLVHLCAEHGFLNPFAHRALFDVLSMMSLLQRYDIERVLALSQEPVVYLQALVQFAQKGLASGRGYRWNPEKRIWWRSFKESQVPDEIKAAAATGFKVVQINKPE